MEFYSAIKKNGITAFASKWAELDNIMLSKISQTQKVEGKMFSLIYRKLEQNVGVGMAGRIPQM